MEDRAPGRMRAGGPRSQGSTRGCSGSRGRESIGLHLRRPSPLSPLCATPPDRSLAFPATPLACRDEECGRSCPGRMRAGGPRSQGSTHGCSGCAGARIDRFASQETISPTPLVCHTSRPFAGVPRNPARVQRRGMWKIVRQFRLRRVGCGPEARAPRCPPPTHACHCIGR